MHVITPQTQNICITFVQRRPSVFDVGPTLYKCYIYVGPTLYKCYTNVLCLLGARVLTQYCRVASKDTNCLLFKLVVTAFWLYKEDMFNSPI